MMNPKGFIARNNKLRVAANKLAEEFKDKQNAILKVNRLEMDTAQIGQSLNFIALCILRGLEAEKKFKFGKTRIQGRVYFDIDNNLFYRDYQCKTKHSVDFIRQNVFPHDLLPQKFWILCREIQNIVAKYDEWEDSVIRKNGDSHLHTAYENTALHQEEIDFPVFVESYDGLITTKKAKSYKIELVHYRGAFNLKIHYYGEKSEQIPKDWLFFLNPKVRKINKKALQKADNYMKGLSKQKKKFEKAIEKAIKKYGFWEYLVLRGI